MEVKHGITMRYHYTLTSDAKGKNKQLMFSRGSTLSPFFDSFAARRSNLAFIFLQRDIKR